MDNLGWKILFSRIGLVRIMEYFEMEEDVKLNIYYCY